MVPRIALVGQQNTGKSTLFDHLCGGQRNTGNWPGKTIAQKEGICGNGHHRCVLVDLPGMRDLAGNSPEEREARDLILSGQFQGIIVTLDASQLGRSLYLLADLIGTRIPLIVVATMAKKGMRIDFKKMQTLLRVPVLPIITQEWGLVNDVIGHIAQIIHGRPIPSEEALFNLYANEFGGEWQQAISLLPATLPSLKWWAVKLLEGDRELCAHLPELIGDGNSDDRALRLASCRYEWIQELLREITIVEQTESRSPGKESILLHPVWGIFLAFTFLIFGCATCIIIAQFLQNMLQPLLPKLASAMDMLCPPFAALFRGAILPGLLITVQLLVFVCIMTFGIAFAEDVGYMARMAYLFDGLMGRIGLGGKSLLPYIAGLGCTAAAVESSRIIGSPRQRLLTIASCWVIPCSGTWGLVGFIATIFFGLGAIWIIGALFLLAFLHIAVTVRVFGRHRGTDESVAMQIPPLHRAHWHHLFSMVLARAGKLLRTSMPLVLATATIFWILHQGSPAPGGISPLFRFGKFVEPFAALIGLHWKLFLAFLLAIMNRESALGALAILFSDEGLPPAVTVDFSDIRSALTASVTPPQALAFLVAFFLNIPCCAAIAITASEVRSWWWTLRLCAYYLCFALIAAGIVFHCANLFF
jgi:ferrous iron transport protein B